MERPISDFKMRKIKPAEASGMNAVLIVLYRVIKGLSRVLDYAADQINELMNKGALPMVNQELPEVLEAHGEGTTIDNTH